jgi:lipid II:glycine glycyltransferase (peptidoglycan interpeptide bridge formation enzyme)
VSLPFTDLCTTEGITPPEFQRSLQYITQLGIQLQWKYWEYRGGAEIVTQAVPSTTFLNHRLKLEHSDDHMFARFQSTTRTALRKAEGAGVQVEIARDIGALKNFYELLCQTRRRHGTPPQPFAFFANLHRHVLQQNRGFIALARKNGQPAAGIFFLQDACMAIYKYAASDVRLQQFRASNLVLWRGIQHLIRRGVTTLDFGRTSMTNSGLQRFKLAWGAEERRLGYLRFDCRTQGYTIVNDRATGWHTVLFRNAPASIGKLFGQFLYRHTA